MNRASRNGAIIAIILMSFLGVILGPIIFQTITNIIKPTSTVVILADCWRTIHILVWEDNNGDGKKDDNEQGIKGMGYKINGIFAELMTDPKLQSDENGKINISLWSPGNCLNSKFAVEVTNIGNRRITTVNPIIFTLKPMEFSYDVLFGCQ